LDQATLGLSREYLIKGLEDKDVKAYLDYQVGLATLLGADRDRALKEQTEALEFEIKLANVSIWYRRIKFFFSTYSNPHVINFDCMALWWSTFVSQINLPREERRDANKLYNPMTIKELSLKVPEIPWLVYMNTILAPHHVLTENERVIVDVPDYFPKLVDLLAKTPKRCAIIFDYKQTKIEI